jgi:hypothetical protein
LYTDRGSVWEAISSYMEAMNLHIVGWTSSKGHELQCENSEQFLSNKFCETQKLRQVVIQNNSYNGRKDMFKLGCPVLEVFMC